MTDTVGRFTIGKHEVWYSPLSPRSWHVSDKNGMQSKEVAVYPCEGNDAALDDAKAYAQQREDRRPKTFDVIEVVIRLDYRSVAPSVSESYERLKGQLGRTDAIATGTLLEVRTRTLGVNDGATYGVLTSEWRKDEQG